MNTYRDIKDIAATAKETLKKEFPNCKFSVRIERFSMGRALHIRLMEADFEVFAPEDKDVFNCSPTTDVNHYRIFDNPTGVNVSFGGTRIPDYSLGSAILTKEGWELCKRMCEIGLVEHWDKSDIQSDYFHCAYYFHAGIGKWDKPFKVVQKGGK